MVDLCLPLTMLGRRVRDGPAEMIDSPLFGRAELSSTDQSVQCFIGYRKQKYEKRFDFDG